MAFEKAYGAMDRDDWNILMEMLDKGELSTKDINRQHHEVRYS